MHVLELIALENIREYCIEKYDIIEIKTKQKIINGNKIQSIIKIRKNSIMQNLDYKFLLFIFQNRNLF